MFDAAVNNNIDYIVENLEQFAQKQPEAAPQQQPQAQAQPVANQQSAIDEYERLIQQGTRRPEYAQTEEYKQRERELHSAVFRNPYQF
ncbi:hypothetical protein [Photobacterium angustum]|uniref:hypothetical protein n=1 Tax=Photobacterium angustum TaxID=661 RepID=UPI0011B1FC45|nr:hypothetical protein [Photobacterium angustum]